MAINFFISDISTIGPPDYEYAIIFHPNCFVLEISHPKYLARPPSWIDFQKSYLASLDTCEDMWNVFHAVVQSGLNILMPIKQIRIHPDDASWMNQRLKSFIQKRQEAFNIYGVNSIQFKQYRNLVNRERKRVERNITNLKFNNLKV